MVDLSIDRLIKALFVENMINIALKLNNSAVGLKVNQADVASLLREPSLNIIALYISPQECQPISLSDLLSLLIKHFCLGPNDPDENNNYYESQIEINCITSFHKLNRSSHMLPLCLVQMVLLHLLLARDLNFFQFFHVALES